MSDALKARRQAFALAAAVAYSGGSKRIAAAIERAAELPPGPPLDPREMDGLFDNEKNAESGGSYAGEDHEAALRLALRFSEVFPTIEIRDSEPFYWLAHEIATLMAAGRGSTDIANG